MVTLTSATPLRAATIWCVELHPGTPVAVGALATLAGVEPSRAKAFASILVARGALVETDAGLAPGPAWAEWSAEPGGRPHSGAKASEEMDTMRMAMARNVQAMTSSNGWSQRELARRAGIESAYINRLFTRAEPLPALACVLVARALGTTVEHLVQQPAPFRS
jgi:DNA-binding Xre family transcriptional regulator